MKNIRIQNDICIKWRVYRYGDKENLTDKPVVVKLLDSLGHASPITYTISDNEVTIMFEGRNQSKLGDYSLLLCENSGQKGMVTIDKQKAFTLVRHSEDEGGCCTPTIDVETVELSSDIDVPCPHCPFEIDENGILTDTATGKQYKLTPYNAPTPPPSGGDEPTDEPEQPKVYAYVGAVQATKGEFTAMENSELVHGLTKIELSTAEQHTTCKKNCFTILLPSNVTLKKASYTSQGLTTVITDGFNLEHEDIEVEGVTYKVYGYRMNAVTESDPLTYDWSVNI